MLKRKHRLLLLPQKLPDLLPSKRCWIIKLMRSIRMSLPMTTKTTTMFESWVVSSKMWMRCRMIKETMMMLTKTTMLKK